MEIGNTDKSINYSEISCMLNKLLHLSNLSNKIASKSLKNNDFQPKI